MDEAAGGNTRLLLNMAECQALNSIAIGALMPGLCRTTRRRGGNQAVRSASGSGICFTMTKLIMVFDHHDREDQAVAVLRGCRQGIRKTPKQGGRTRPNQ